MAKKINIVGAKPKKIEVVDQPKRRIDPADLAAALGANPSGQFPPGNLDPIGLAELGTQLLHRLRSSGGRPALADASINCRVPLSAEDVQTLENMVSHIGASTGAKPSVGQLVSVIVRLHLNALKSAPEGHHPHLGAVDIAGQLQGDSSAHTNNPRAQDSSWLDAENGKRQKYRQVQEIVQQAGTTWGKKKVA
jgi:hypothetical protein